MNLKFSFYQCLRHAFMSGAGYGDFEKIRDRDIGRWTEYDPPRSGSFAQMEEAIASLTHPSPSASEAQVRVKALGWSPRNDQPQYEVCADTPFGRYQISCRGEYGYGWKQPRQTVWSGFLPTIDDAKAAAQADYERRILSALSTPEQGETEAAVGSVEEFDAALDAFVERSKAEGGYLPAIATLLRIKADELADRYPDDANGGCAALESEGQAE